MSRIEKDIYENGNYAAYANSFRDSQLESENAIAADIKQANIKVQQEAKQSATAKTKASVEAIKREQFNEGMSQQYKRILDHQGR